jgi:hypothetical protein
MFGFAEPVLMIPIECLVEHQKKHIIIGIPDIIVNYN